MVISKKSSLFFFTVIILSISILSGCLFDSGSPESEKLVQTPATVPETKDETQIVTDFNQLLGKNPQIGEIIAFIDANVADLSSEKLTTMIEELEAIQEQGLVGLEEKYNSSEINEKLNQVFSPEFYLENVNNLKDEAIKELLNETRAAGFKIDINEGMYVPVIDYEIYQKYLPKVTEAMKNYLQIMLVESKQVPAKDGELLIKWDDLVNRALIQEKFIKNHGSSKRIDKVKELYERYVYFIFFGTDNTPLFNRETGVMDQNAQTAYSQAINNNQESELMQKLAQYLKLLADNDYQLSDSAANYRNNLISKK